MSRHGAKSKDEVPKRSWRSRQKDATQFATSYVESLVEKEREEDSSYTAASPSQNNPAQEIYSASSITGREIVNQSPGNDVGTDQPSTSFDDESEKVCTDEVMLVDDHQFERDIPDNNPFPDNDLIHSYKSNTSDEVESEIEENIEVPRSIYLPLLCIGFYLKHKLTKVALEAHLNIMRLNENSYIKRISSVHNLLSKYRYLETEVTKIYICGKKSCGAILQLDALKKCPLANQPCGHKRKPTFSSGGECFVIRLPIEKQLVHFIQHGGLATTSEEDPNYRGDITTGGLYQKLKIAGVIDERTVTIQLNTDGAEIFEMLR